MKVYALQFDIAWEDKAANFARVRSLLVGASPEPGSLIVLPEMFATGFSMNAATIAETPKGPTFAFLSELARQYQGFVLAGVATRDDDGLYHNECLIFHANGGSRGGYEKMYPFTLGGERAVYRAGELPRVIDVPYSLGNEKTFLLSPFICYDLRFPEAFREAAGWGAQVYTVIASWPEARTHHWVALLQARAIENQAYVIGVNRCGVDPFFKYSGRSLIIGPDGSILADAGEQEGVISATLDLDALTEYRCKLPFLQDMRQPTIEE